MEGLMDLKLPKFSRPLHQHISPAVFAGPSQVRAYWEGLRQNGRLPDRAQLDPRGFGGVLDRVFLAEPIGRGLVQVRISGSALCEAAGMDLRGLPLSCLFSSEARPALAEALEQVSDGIALAEFDLGASRGGLGTLARLVLLPLTDGADRRLVLGCLGHADGLLGPGLKFTILRRLQERLAPAPQPAVEPPPVRKVPHLTLVHARD
jgi:hypothetical protein